MAADDEQILRDYILVGVLDTPLVGRVRANLAAAKVVFGGTVPAGSGQLTPQEKQDAAEAQALRTTRQNLIKFFEVIEAPLDFGGGSPVRSPAEHTRELYRLVQRRQFPGALTLADNLASMSLSLPALSVNGILAAFTPADRQFKVIVEIERPDKPPLRVKQTNTLKGYKGDKLNTDQIRQLIDFRSFLAGGDERDFRLGLVRGECHFGLARANMLGGSQGAETHFAAALAAYAALLPEITTIAVAASKFTSVSVTDLPDVFDHFAAGEPLADRQRFVATRDALAHVGLGDALYRRSFRLTADERAETDKVYRGGAELARRAGTGDAARLADYAEAQRRKLAAGQTFAGYRDSHVPDFSLTTLADLVHRRVAIAQHARQRYDDFKTRADRLVEDLATLGSQELQEELGVQIARLAVDNAQTRIDDADLVLDGLDAKDDFFREEAGGAADLGKAVFGTLVLRRTGVEEFGGEANVAGVVSTLVGYFGARADLRYQRKAANNALEIATRDKQIADLEKLVADNRLLFVQQQIKAKTLGTFNADRFFALANAYEDMARRQTDRAMELLYLYERAISMRRLKTLQIVEPRLSQIDILLAPDALDGVLADLELEAKTTGKGQPRLPLPPFSLAEHYPLELARFRQTREMSFVISVYDVEKLLHGRFNVRVRSVEVEFDGVLPAGGFVGTVVHGGVTLLRDRDATLNPAAPATRLDPDEQEIQDAIDALNNGSSERVAVQGLVPLVLGEDRLTITSEPTPPLPDDDDDPFELQPLQNYGLTGTWGLLMPDTDMRQITDVKLRFVVRVPVADGPLDRHIGGLIEKFETEQAGPDGLDRILVVSLRLRAEDVFQDPQASEASFELVELDFPDTTDVRVRSVVAQALDPEHGGVPGLQLEIAKPGTNVAISRTTGPDGLTEDLDAGITELPEPDRPDPLGPWTVRLLGDARFAQLRDLTLFFVHSFRSVES